MLKNPKGSPLLVFRHCETFFFKIFVSPKGPPFNFFDILQQIGCLKIPKGPSPLSVFRHCETFFRKFVFSPKGPPFNCDENVDNFGSVSLLARQGLAPAGPGAPFDPFFGFSIFEYCKLTLGCPFAIFEPWIWRRLGPVPACLQFNLIGSQKDF